MKVVMIMEIAEAQQREELVEVMVCDIEVYLQHKCNKYVA
jgi:hypothetical protein